MKTLWVYITVPDVATGRRLAERWVEERRIACANIVPRIEAIYRWKGRLERGREAALIVKTTTRRWRALLDAVRRDHPYECPCVLALEVSRGAAPFLGWIAAETGASAGVRARRCSAE
ncbi:MAG: divalent-cation tolerance protein CutA [Kiritimatiellae bacterium]|nr:divalent-cation tolerance protein CutA [Kiritimatiellia bacterium]